METMDYEQGQYSQSSRRNYSDLMTWLRSIDITKHVTERDIVDMFVDGVLMFHLLRELFEEKIEDADGLMEKLLPSENYFERLINWKIINEHVLEKLKIGKSSWFMEYVAKGNLEYIESVLNAIREIAPPPPRRIQYDPPRKSYYYSDIVTPAPEVQEPYYPRVAPPELQEPYYPRVAPPELQEPYYPRVVPTSPQPQQTRTYWVERTDLINDAFFKAKTATRRVVRSRQPSPFPRMKLARERVIWGSSPRYPGYYDNRPSFQPAYPQRPNPYQYQRRFQTQRSNDYRYYKNGRFGYDRSNQGRSYYQDPYNYEGQKLERKPPPVDTYCFLDRKIGRKRTSRWQPIRTQTQPAELEEGEIVEDINTRFQQLLQKYSAAPYSWRNRNRHYRNREYSRYLYKYYDQFPRDCNYCRE